MLVELKVSMAEVIGDSQLVLKQLFGEYKCTSLALAPYFALAVQLLEEFDDVSIRHVPRDQNYEANEMSHIASGLDESFEMLFDVHDGICGAHQARIKMHRLICRHVRSLRITIQHNLQSREYDEAMMLELEDLEDTRLTALDRLQAQKLKIAKSNNKRVKGKNLAVRDLVCKAILPLGKKDHRFGKWSPNWEGPF
ncbi:hypothetical protein SLEP1_g55429 [Rubroshorea leprosula]|uniref:RNase H type-1 domain-containing protein n=1 Tax=Rubroshorea leprosula TaxID=152421 RepID=A0AAV5MFH7_9ROSI|nr:hypothetical protein SLEP1_g55429 [Rubroshorea leprosula]